MKRASFSAISMSNRVIHNFHIALCWPGITRLFHYVRQKNLPYSLADVKKVCGECRTKAKFFSLRQGQLIKATRPMERLNIDFKGPLPLRINTFFAWLTNIHVSLFAIYVPT